ncbi:uncharacterized protein N7515_005688 [Penicillium bovifimosum]|uniref:Ankyrin n=1 Tax=Penicillium bovifimosum TaxID=126998 RepID=A0A9W9L034_9EURO|nr:uncharacterized protein N7515_005688 [Penicillium bovifimosum]KAJ5129649.1 hypothetical protein N7515_005688 [Penicillium bovifimosum]
MPLYHLPNKLILLIAENLESNGDLNSLIQTNIHLCKLLDPLLYLRDAASYATYGPLAMLHAARGGMRIQLENHYKQDASLTAAENGHDGVIKLFLDSDESLDLDEENIFGETPLVCAAKWGHEVVVKQLLSTGRVNVNFVCCGFTPLCYAAWNGHEAVVNLLLDADGINLDFAHSDGRTAIDLAAETGYESTVKLLIAAGAELGDKGHTVTYGMDMPGTALVGGHAL